MKIRLSYQTPDCRNRHTLIDFKVDSVVPPPNLLTDNKGIWRSFIEGVPLKGPVYIESNRLMEQGRFIIEFKAEERNEETIIKELKKANNDLKDALSLPTLSKPSPPDESKTVDPDFWDYLSEKASETDHWWLDTWLEEELEKYNKKIPCPNCNSKRSYEKRIWSKTGNWTLETHTKCKNCKHRLSIEDNRPLLREALRKGNTLKKDIKTLEKELKEGKP